MLPALRTPATRRRYAVIFSFSREQDELRATVRRFLAASSPAGEVRRLMETERGYDEAVWTRMAQQLGLQGLAVPEQYGGSGCGPVEQAIAMEEMGRVLLCAPYLSTAVLAAQAILSSHDPEAATRYLPGICDGTTVATVAVAEDAAHDRSPILARPAGPAYRLDGHATFVLDGRNADLLLVPADGDDGPTLFAVSGDTPGLARRAVDTLDRTRKQAVIDLDDVAAARVGRTGAAREILDRAVRAAAVALAAEQVGGAQRCLDMSVDYAKSRRQFGRPIGSFQAVKHLCADMLLDVESARSAAYYAAWAAADGQDDAVLAASLAKALCSEVYLRTAARTIQVHGGIGFTWEHDAHLYFRRAKSTEVMLGTPQEHRERSAALLLAAT
ncbi:MAG TPA: acyl-CoA dehydrogenase family protein [Mycobacteriales bacterium]